MRINMLFLILALITIPMAINLGEGSNWLWVNSTEENRTGLIGVVYVIALVIGVSALFVRMYCMSDDNLEENDVDFNLIMGGATMLSVFCFSYLYAFTVAPVTSEGGWMSGWLIYMVVGLLPVILEINIIVSDMIKNSSQQPTGENEKVQNIRKTGL